MDLLKQPDAQALLDDAALDPAAVASCAPQLEAFLARYLPCFYRSEQRHHARTVLQGKLTGLERKTTEPIASQAGEQRRSLRLAGSPKKLAFRVCLTNSVQTKSILSSVECLPRRLHDAA